jgi:hypothetical protein
MSNTRFAPFWRDWKTLCRELFVTFAGVLAALGTTAWYSEHQDRARERVDLQQLRSDVDADTVELRRVVALETRAVKADDALFVALSVARPLLEDSLKVWNRSGWLSLSTPKLRIGVAKALAQTSEGALVRDDSLRFAITSFIGQYDDATSALARLEERHSVAVENFAHYFVSAMSPDSLSSGYVPERAIRLSGSEPRFREVLYLVTSARHNRIARLRQLLDATDSLRIALEKVR